MDLQPLHALIVEDNVSDVRLIEALLEEHQSEQFTLEHVKSLDAALERLRRAGVDIILLDLNLPPSRGMETLRTLREANRAVPVVVMTGFGSQELAREAVRTGAQDYLVKGEIDADRLVRSIVYAFERNRAEQSLRESEGRLRLLTGQIPAVLWTTNRLLQLTSVEGGGLRALELDSDSIVGQTVREVFESDDHPGTTLQMHEKALTGITSSGLVPWRERFFQFYVEALRDPNQYIVGTIGVALDVTTQRRMEQGLRVARRIQQHLLPEKAPDVKGMDIAGRCFPAEHCSGDYFDYITLRDGSLAIVVADASGHGFGPAILTTTVRSYLRAAAMQQGDIHEMLTTVNWLLANDSAPDQYVTMFCCRIDPETQSFSFAAAGHQALIVDANNQARILESECMPLGIDSSETFQLSRNIAMRPGDILLFVTDGILEARSPADEFFGTERLIERLKLVRDQPADAIVQSLYEDVLSFANSQVMEDDITAIVAKFEGDVENDDYFSTEPITTLS